MNKKKLVELADEVMLEVDIEMKGELRKNLEEKLCERLSILFDRASTHVRYKDSSYPDAAANKRQKEAYVSVKPVLDDCLDKILGEKDVS
jgi:hypothetical protein